MSEEYLIQTSEMEKLAELSEHFLQLTEDDQIDYQKITDDLREISGAQYAVFNLYGPQGEYFNTMAVSGAGKSIKVAFNILGYDFTKRKWDIDPIRQNLISGHTITRFSSVAFLAGNLIPKPIADALQTAFHVGEIILINISKQDEMLGDCVLVMQKGKTFDKELIVEIYSRQIGLVITRKRAELALRESNLNFKGIFDKGPIGIAYHRMIYDKSGKAVDFLFLEANQCYQELTGVNPVGKLVTEAFPGIEKDPFDWIGVYGKVAKDGAEIHFQQYLQTNQRWYDCLCYQYKLDHFVVIFLEITERKAIEAALSEAEAINREILANISEAIFILNEKGEIKFQSSNLERLFGWASKDVHGDNYLNVIHPNDKSRFTHEFNSIMKKRIKRISFECRMRMKSGAYTTIELTALNLLDNPSINGILVDLHDISDRKEAEQERIFMSYNDYLTGLYNRRFFEAELNRIDTERNLPITIIMGDVNGLKFINDSFGHDKGDELLVKTAEIFKKIFREDEIIARLGGDEFAVLLPKTSKAEAEKIIHRINTLVAEVKIENFKLSISFGFETKQNSDENLQDVMKSAEDKMYRVKLYESRSLRSKTIDIVMNALVEKSDRELTHSKRVSSLCERIAIDLGYKTEQVNQIRMAGLVHDIGKIGIEESILNKTEKLDEKEWIAIRKHPEAGWRILNSANEFSELSEFILCHHERWDGKGYPRGLSGEKIPIEARIIAVADAFDAMTSKRSYREEITVEEAISEITRCSGTQFDPMIVKVFIEKVMKKS
ncbi:MAG: diguanylate cyclase [Erysipelotrichales bacterium]|nr:MAG: diguanylate cyclase [Erysipelotrichales bacterium]